MGRADLIRGLYGIADAAASGGDPEWLAAAMLEGGCRLVQLRAKGWAADDVVAVARAIRERCHAVGAVLIVNDDARIALAAGADGVHLGQTDGSTAAARAILGEAAIIGRSSNDRDQAIAADGDYVAFGPVFPTSRLSRPKPVRGLEALAAIREAVDRPLVAIGGIGPENLAEVRATGVDAWAVIGAIATAVDPVAATRDLVE